jgi:hypothetical protein
MPFLSLVVHLKVFSPIIIPKLIMLKQPISYTPFANIVLVEHVRDVPTNQFLYYLFR